MEVEIVGKWWVLALRGVADITLGIAAFAWPGITLLVLVVLFGAYAFMDGAFALLAGGLSRSWLLVVEGVLGVVAGLLALFWPAITTIALLFLVAAWAVVTGLTELVAAVRLRRFFKDERLLVLGGLAPIVLGVLLVANPAAGVLTLILLIGAYVVLSGLLSVGLALNLR